MRFALLPAAGQSRRMGRPKLSLPLGDRTILEHILATLQQAAVEPILVVVGPHVRELTSLARSQGAEVCQLDDETPDMRATIEKGLRWLEERYRPRPADDWLLVPADHPALAASVVQQLGEARRSHPQRSIFVPTFEGRRGHPLLLTWSHVARLRAHPPDQGLNTYVRQHDSELVEVAVESEAILWDLDTPEDYERLRRLWSSRR
jgi:molybdenum cofactor cytidylyltransferase